MRVCPKMPNLDEKVTVSRMKRHLGSKQIRVFRNQRGERKVTKQRVTYTALSDFKERHNEKGQRVCLNCEKVIEDKRRRKYCCEDCSKEFFRKHYWTGMREYILKKQNRTCQKCGREAIRNGDTEDPYSNYNYIVDHIIPIALGGSEFDEDNLQVLCGICNKEKTKTDQAKITKLKREHKLTFLSNNFEVSFKEFYSLNNQRRLLEESQK